MVYVFIFFFDSDDEDKDVEFRKNAVADVSSALHMCTCDILSALLSFFFKVQMESFTGHVHQATMCIVQREAVGDLDRKNSFYIPIELAVYVPILIVLRASQERYYL